MYIVHVQVGPIEASHSYNNPDLFVFFTIVARIVYVHVHDLVLFHLHSFQDLFKNYIFHDRHHSGKLNLFYAIILSFASRSCNNSDQFV